MQNPFAIHTNLIHPLPGFNMGASTQHIPGASGPQKPEIGIHGPWSINPGNPRFPNHRPYLTNIKPPNEAAPAPSAQLKFK